MTLVHIRSSSLLFCLCLGALAIPFGCAGSQSAKPAKSDRTLEEATVAARAEFEQDRIDQAATFYTLALERARALDRPLAIGDTAYNLAACLLRLHQYDRAKALLAEAGHELARVDAPLADVLLLQARAAQLAGDTPAAEMFMHQLRTDPRSKPSVAHLGQAVILEGRMACARSDWDGATKLLRQTRDILGPDADTLLQAQLVALTGRIAMGTNDFRTAAEAFDRQADLLSHARQYRALSSVLAQAGDAYAASKEHGLAADRLYRAARSAATWGQIESAKKWAVAALAAAHQAEDDAIVYLIESLLSEFATTSP